MEDNKYLLNGIGTTGAKNAFKKNLIIRCHMNQCTFKKFYQYFKKQTLY